MPEILTKAQKGAYDSSGGIEAPEKMKEIITELHDVAFDKSVDQKSKLISDNVKGIVQIQVFNDTLYNRFGFRVSTRDKLVDSKLRVVKSRDGYGLERLEAVLKSLKSEMNMMPGQPPGILDAALTVRKNT